VFDEAVKKRIANVVTYNTMIDAYGKRGMVEKAREVFEEAVKKRIADVVTYTAMIDAYGKNGRVEEAREVFEEAVEKRIADVVTYTTICSLYYSLNRFKDVEDVVSKAQHYIKTNPTIFLIKMEALRKQKEKRWAVVQEISKFLETYPFKVYTDETYVLANTIMAYALKDMERREEAKKLFENLMENVPLSSIHYPRILCGYVFSTEVSEIDENTKKRIITLLEIASRETNGNLLNDINDALSLLRNI
ncbi:MAG: pentatricopeptide repeat-containing protein, partial [Candidatus Anstonellales archaeon]